MPVRDDDRIKGFQRSTRALPLSVSDDDGTPVLILFSSPERAKEFVKGFPGYEGGLLTEFTVGFDMPATLVAAMAERAGTTAGE